jgi:hypothetical protein
MEKNFWFERGRRAYEQSEDPDRLFNDLGLEDDFGLDKIREHFNKGWDEAEKSYLAEQAEYERRKAEFEDLD